MVAIGHQDTNMHITPRVRCSSVLISCPLKESKKRTTRRQITSPAILPQASPMVCPRRRLHLVNDASPTQCCQLQAAPFCASTPLSLVDCDASTPPKHHLPNDQLP